MQLDVYVGSEPRAQGHRRRSGWERQVASLLFSKGIKHPLNRRFEDRDVLKNKGGKGPFQGRGNRLAPSMTQRENLLLLKCSEQYMQDRVYRTLLNLENSFGYSKSRAA